MPAGTLPREHTQAAWPNNSNTEVVMEKMANGLKLRVYGDLTPSGVAGYAKGCIHQNTGTAVVSGNTGTTTSCTFTSFT